MKFNLALILFFIPLINISQTFEPNMAVTIPELKANVYEKDSTAQSLVIYDYGNAFFQLKGRNIRLYVDIEQKIKILSREELDRGEFSFDLYKNIRAKE